MSRCHKDGYAMEVGTDWLGRTIAVCPACERTRQGKCFVCGKVRDQKGRRRCKVCQEKHRAKLNHFAHRDRQSVKGRQLHPNPGRCATCKATVPSLLKWYCDNCLHSRRLLGWRKGYRRRKTTHNAACQKRYWSAPEKYREAARARYRRDIVKIKRRRFKKAV